MALKFLQGKAIEIISFTISLLAHLSIPLLVEQIFHSQKLILQFYLLVIPGILIYSASNIIGNRWSINTWKAIRNNFYFISIFLFLFLLYYGIKHISSTDYGFTYFKGNNYTSDSIKYLRSHHVSDDDLVSIASDDIYMIWTDCGAVKGIFLFTLISALLTFDTSICANRQVKKMASLKNKRKLK